MRALLTNRFLRALLRFRLLCLDCLRWGRRGFRSGGGPRWIGNRTGIRRWGSPFAQNAKGWSTLPLRAGSFGTVGPSG